MKSTINKQILIVFITALILTGCAPRTVLVTKETPYGLCKLDAEGNVMYVWSPDERDWIPFGGDSKLGTFIKKGLGGK